VHPAPASNPSNDRFASGLGEIQEIPSSTDLTWWERTSFGVAHGAACILLKLLGIGGLYRFGRAFGTLEWIINFKRRRRFGRALREVVHPLPGRLRRRYTRDHFRQTRCDKLYYHVFGRIPRETAQAGLTIANQKLLDQALARGKGAYLALCHHGPLHVGAMLMALRGYKVAGVRDRREGAMRRYIRVLYDQQ